MGPAHDLARLIRALESRGVQYLLVGGAAARAYGATRLTEDADCVVSRQQENLVRLAGTLRGLNARLRVAGMTDEEARSLPVQLDAEMWSSAEISTWMTDAGGFDVLAGPVDAGGRMVPNEQLVERENIIRGEGFTIRAAALEDIVAPRSMLADPKTSRPYPSCTHCPQQRRRRPGSMTQLCAPRRKPARIGSVQMIARRCAE